MHIMKKNIISNSFICLMFCIIVITAVIPILWIASTSIKNTHEVFAYPPVLIPPKPAFQNYSQVFSISEISWAFGNSIIVAAITTVAVITLSSLASYGFSRFKFRAKSFFMLLLLGTQMIPAVTNIIPLYITMLRLRLLDTILSLCLVYSAMSIPFSIWIIKSYFDSISPDIDEAARIDGASRLYIVFRKRFPISIAGIASAAVFCFTACWNEFAIALVLSSTLKSRTIPLSLFTFQGSYDIQWNLLCAASIAAMIPVVLLFIALQDRFISGLTQGAVKG